MCEHNCKLICYKCFGIEDYKIDIYNILDENPISINEISKKLKITKRVVYRHTKKLLELGLITKVVKKCDSRGRPKSCFCINSVNKDNLSDKIKRLRIYKRTSDSSIHGIGVEDIL